MIFATTCYLSISIVISTVMSIEIGVLTIVADVIMHYDRSCCDDAAAAADDDDDDWSSRFGRRKGSGSTSFTSVPAADLARQHFEWAQELESVEPWLEYMGGYKVGTCLV